MFGGGELNASRYNSFFGGRIVIFYWYTCGAVVRVRSCNVDCYVQRDRLRCSFANVILENTRDICTRDVQVIEIKKVLKKTNHFEMLGVSASHGFLLGYLDVQIASHKDKA